MSLDAKSVDSPDAIRVFLDGSERAVVRLGAVVIGRGIYRPGRRWSQYVRPLTGHASAAHTGYVISGHMVVRVKDGSELEVGPGVGFVAAPGHDAWVVGNEPCVQIDFAVG